MEYTVCSQSVKNPDQDSLLLARSILKDVMQLVRSIRAMASVFLRFARMGQSITNYLMAWLEPSAVAEA